MCLEINERPEFWFKIEKTVKSHLGFIKTTADDYDFLDTEGLRQFEHLIVCSE